MRKNANYFELSVTQKGIYFDSLIDSSVAYNISACVEFENIDETHFENAMKLVVSEQELLRSSIETVNDAPVNYIHDHIDFNLEKFDLTHCEKNSGSQQAAITRILNEKMSQAFDFHVAPLFRVALLKLHDNQYIFIICIHHIIADGISINLLIDKLLNYHAKLKACKTISLSKTQSLSTYIKKENNALKKGIFALQKNFWNEKLNHIQACNITPDYPSAKKAGVGAEKRFVIEKHFLEAANEFAMNNEISVFIFFLSIYAILVHRHVKNEDIVISLPFSYRSDTSVESAIGCFIRMLPLRIKMQAQQSFMDVVKQVAYETLEAYKNIEYPCNLILRDNLSQTETEASAIFDTLFVYDHYETYQVGDSSAKIITQDQVTFPGNIMLVINKTPDHDFLKIHYKKELFSESTIDNLAQSYLQLMEQILTNPEATLHHSVTQLANETAVTDETASADGTKAADEIKTNITHVWKEVLGLQTINLDDNFFDIGGNSFHLIAVNNKLKKFNLDLNIRIQFQLPTLRSLITHFTKQAVSAVTSQAEIPEATIAPSTSVINSISRDIAIIGMSINVPGAQTCQAFWENLKQGKESIHFYRDDELLAMGIPTEILQSPNYVKAIGKIDGIEAFDAGFFDYPPAEVHLMSPQYRILHKGIWEALEDAGYYPGSDLATMGMYLSGSDDFEWYKEEISNQHNYSLKYQAFTLSTNHFLATRLAYKFNFKGPVFTALSGCSSTLVTTHLASQALMLGECDLAIAGGITIELPIKGGYFYEEGMMFSPDGHCRPFDAKAAGTFFASGMGLVVLKRLADAVRDGDHIYAVIKGSAINNDGSEKLGFTAPSVQGQLNVIKKAYQVAGVDPKTISYVEAHGTGTALGDPIEVESLSQAFQGLNNQSCVLSSVKGNIGHPDTAAGVVSLIKVALSLENKFIPGTCNYVSPNPKMEIENSPFIIKSAGTAWEKPATDISEPLRAGLNSFGVGGTNTHIVIEEAPNPAKNIRSAQPETLVFSAKSKQALENTSKAIIKYLTTHPEINLADAAWTLQVGRQSFQYRKSISVSDHQHENLRAEWMKKLDTAAIYDAKLLPKKVFFMFAGQGSQYQGMARDLYFSDESHGFAKLFKDNLNRTFQCLAAAEKKELLNVMFGTDDSQKINQTQYSQLAIFTVSYALAAALIDIGIQPTGMCGHSIGELVAATIAGVFKLKDAIAMVRQRGQLMQQQIPGVMLAVMASEHEIAVELGSDLWVALKNSTNTCVIGGSDEAIQRFEKKCEDYGWFSARLNTSHAFHTPMMKDAALQFSEVIKNYQLNNPQIPMLSNQSGTWITDSEVTNPNYWGDHILNPVNFEQCLTEVLVPEGAVLIEIGTGRSLSSMVKQHIQYDKNHVLINLIRHQKENFNDVEYANQQLGYLWSLGININWQKIKGADKRFRVSLPTYVFDESNFPINAAVYPPQGLKGTKSFSQQPLSLPAAVSAPIIDAVADHHETLETKIVHSVKNVLGFDSVQIDDDFFDLGGDSLKAIQLASEIKNLLGIRLEIKDIFNYRTPRQLAVYLQKQVPVVVTADTVAVVQEREFYPLTSAQKRMYMQYLLDKNSLAYNLISATLISGAANADRFQETLKKLIQRHEALRTSIEMKNDVPVQVVHSTCEVPFTYSETTISNLDQLKILIDKFSKPFDLSSHPLFRAELVKLGHDSYVLLFDIHHIVADGTSMEIFSREFNELYVRDLPELKFHYKDFAVSQTEQHDSQILEAQKTFWKNYLKNPLPVLEIPTDFPRPNVKDTRGDRLFFAIDTEFTAKLKNFTRETHSTLFMLLLSAWKILLARYSGQEDIIVGVPVAGRTQKTIENTIGMFVNMLPIKSSVANKKLFTTCLQELKESVLEAFEHQDFQFDDLVQMLNVHRDLSRNALFDVCFDYQNMDFHELRVDELTFKAYPLQTKVSIYDLVLTCQEDKVNGNLQIFIDYSTTLFKPETIHRLFANYQTLLHTLLANKSLIIEDIDLISNAEKKLYQEFNATILPSDNETSIIDLFASQVRKNPNKVALITSSGAEFTYADLNARSSVLAAELLELKVERGAIVGVFAERNEDLWISLLGILKAGAAFLLIEPSLPASRQQYLAQQCTAKWVLCSTQYHKQLNVDINVLDVSSLDYNNKSELPTLDIHKNDLAYVMFTSGSTGIPKGVLIEHGSVLNFISDIQQRKIFEKPNDRIISLTAVSFDIFIFESLVPLCTGHSIYIANNAEQLDPVSVNQKIIMHDVSHLLSTVSRIKLFVAHAKFKESLQQLKVVLSGGENFPLELLRDLQAHSKAKIYNMYGPTETTIWSTTKELTTTDHITIGKPIANTEAYIGNAAGKLQPIGVFGELYLSGKGVARGYKDNVDETAARFMTASESIRFYKTGDRARYLDNGELELSGRFDNQIKVRGYRIELSEIEQIVLQHKDVLYAVATVIDDAQANKQIILYYTLRTRTTYLKDDSKGVQKWLADRVPHYMLPSQIIELQEMPVLSSGKIDKKSLPHPSDKISTAREIDLSKQKMPTNFAEVILQLWCEVLLTVDIGVNDNFFDLGGNSLGLIQINNKLNTILNITVPLLELFKYPTVKSFANYLQTEGFVMQENINSHDEEPIIPDHNAIAVIGISGRFPGANNVEEFWGNICSGRETLTHFDKEELRASGIDSTLLANPQYISAKGYLQDTEYFDAEFFGYSNQDATLMDPQMRALHQTAWEVLEDAAYDPSNYDGRIGMFAGSGTNILWLNNLIKGNDDLVNAFEILTLNEKDFQTTRLSYKLNLKGPSFNVQTACSTSLVAIHQAIQSLQSGECEMAIAGGVAISYPRKEGYVWHEGMIFSKDGHCRPFSDNASGIVPGNGCGLVLLKPLSQALRDHDHIYAVVKGSAINNDGINKVGYTAPSSEGQQHVIRAALNKAKISADEIQYLEAHGTGTKLGDPIEIDAVKNAWNTQKKNYCALGSIKANVGHLDAAAGVASFIKTALILRDRKIPPHINMNKLNPALNIENSPFYIPDAAIIVNDESTILRAGVSSFGIGGTNAHVILEQAPLQSAMTVNDAYNILVFSAKNPQSLNETTQKTINYLNNHHATHLSDAAWTLQVGRKHFEYRKMIVVGNSASSFDNKLLQAFSVSEAYRVNKITPKAYFVFASDDPLAQSSAVALYQFADKSRLSNIYKLEMNNIIDEFDDELKLIVTQLLNQQSINHAIDPNYLDALFLFIHSYALAKSLLNIGIKPAGILGQGVGELCALTLTEVLNLKDTLQVIKTSYPSLAIYQPGEITKITARKRAANGFTNDNLKILENYQVNQPKLDVLADSESLSTAENSIFIDLTLSQVLSDQIRNQLANRASIAFVNLNTIAKDPEKQLAHLNNKLGELWCHGLEIDWVKLHGNTHRNRVSLPTYSFSKTSYPSDIANHGNFITKSVINDVPALTVNQNIEKSLKSIWQELFGNSDINSEDDFLQLGGDSMKAIVLAAKIKESLAITIPIAEIFKHSKFASLTAWLNNQMPELAQNEVPSDSKIELHPTSFAQKRLYATHELLEGALPYNLMSAYALEGQLDKAKLKAVFDTLVKRHEAFRTRFVIDANELFQTIDETIESVMVFENCAEEHLNAHIQASLQPFDLGNAPLIRVKLLSVNENRHVLIIDMHHIIADQTSIAIVIDEFTKLYAGAVLTPIQTHYRDFAVWQNKSFTEPELSKQLDYWKNEFRGEIPILNLSTDFPRAKYQDYQGDSINHVLDAPIVERIEQIAQQYALTPYMVFMAALKIALWKYTDQRDLVVGTAIAGRNRADLYSIVGMFANTLAIRSKIDPNQVVIHYLDYIKEKLLHAYSNQDCQFEMLLDELNVNKDLSRNPLFDVAINYINSGNSEFIIPSVAMSAWQALPRYAKFDLNLTIEKKSAHYQLDIEYRTSLFKRDTITAFMQHFVNVLRAMVTNEKLTLSELSILDNQEEQWLIHGVNSDAILPCDGETLIDYFEEQVALGGDKVAVVLADEKLSYQQLNNEANRIAQVLLNQGIKPENKVALLIDNSPLQIAAIIGILKCRCAYVPIDPKLPLQRMKHILNDSGAKILLLKAIDEFQAIRNECKTLLIDDELNGLDFIDNEFSQGQLIQDRSIDDAAYIMYTSGSTGFPKGVITTHANIKRIVKNANYVDITAQDQILQLSNYAFDGSTFGIFGALTNGATLHLVTHNQLLDLPTLTDYIAEQKISLFFITTALFNKLVEGDLNQLKKIKNILFGGENPSIPHVKKAFAALGNGKLIHVYGPTETTVFASYYAINTPIDNNAVLPIGMPVSNTSLYVLDSQQKPVPCGVIGELYIGGTGVAVGYINQPELTQQKFLVNPFANKDTVYKTGDLVKRLASGELIFIGRVDKQIKIRGYRIELSEIEARLKDIDGVCDVAVICLADKHDDKYIAAYYTRRPDTNLDKSVFNPRDIRTQLSREIPDYMIPKVLVEVATLPLTFNGKIDVKSLSSLKANPETNIVAVNRDEQTLLMILNEMRNALDNQQLLPEDDFFAAGGQSIKAISLTQNLLKQGIKLKVQDIFEYPTASALFEYYHAKVSKVIEFPKLQGLTSLNCNQNFTLTEDQKESLLVYVNSANQVISDVVSRANCIAEFPFSPIQVLHSKYESRNSGFMMQLDNIIEEHELREKLALLIQKNQLLHCTTVLTATSAKWKEHDVSLTGILIAKMIPYVDLLPYENEAKQTMVDKIINNLMNIDSTSTLLPWKICCVRLDRNLHYVIWAFDHVAFDGMSADVLRSQIQDELPNSNIKTTLPNYSEYVRTINDGPINISETEIINHLNLIEWSALQADIMPSTKSHAKSRTYHLSIPMQQYGISEPWQFAYKLIIYALMQHFEKNQIPFLLVSYARQYADNSYFNCVGEFLDLIPCISDLEKSESSTAEILSLCRKHAINFTALTTDKKLSKRYPNIKELLSSSFKPKESVLPAILFNFQGYIASNERQVYQTALFNENATSLSSYFISVNYDDEHLNIQICCPQIHYKKIKAIIDTDLRIYQTPESKMIEVNYV